MRIIRDLEMPETYRLLANILIERLLAAGFGFYYPYLRTDQEEPRLEELTRVPPCVPRMSTEKMIKYADEFLVQNTLAYYVRLRGYEILGAQSASDYNVFIVMALPVPLLIPNVEYANMWKAQISQRLNLIKPGEPDWVKKASEQLFEGLLLIIEGSRVRFVLSDTDPYLKLYEEEITQILEAR